ncbi:MAG TPA: low temperature requirement protein A [Actinomycetes bacterium]|nr:low temperature requirement protein A [Actinomycetes bacterium]
MSTTVANVRRLIRPPALRTAESATASRLELFFDLAYVLVVLELADAFYADLTLRGTVTFVALFVGLWFSWVGFTLYANRFDTDDVVFRIAKLAATLAVAGCAAAATGVTGAFSTAFAVSFLLGRIILLLLLVRAWRHVAEARPTISVYLGSTALSATLWAVSLGFGGPARYWVWVAAVGVDAAGPIVATWRGDRAPLHMEHLPERFALLVILVLGEAVGGASTGVHDGKWIAPSVAVGVVGFMIAAALWWNYFDITADDSEERLQEDDDPDDAGREDEPGSRADERHDLFVYGHLPLTLGVVMTGVGLEDLVAHPSDPLPSTGGWTLASGVALYLIGTAMIVAGTRRSWRATWPWPTIALPIVALVTLPRYDGALLFVGGLALICVVLAVAGTLHAAAQPDPRDPQTDQGETAAGDGRVG